LSHRAVTEEAAEKEKQQLLQSLEAGQVVKGTVQRITSFGAFVDIGGVDGLVHISELSHTHVENVSDVLSVDDAIEVEILSVDLCCYLNCRLRLYRMYLMCYLLMMYLKYIFCLWIWIMSAFNYLIKIHFQDLGIM